MASSKNRFVTIRHPKDVIEAEMLKDLLEQEGIAVSIPGIGQSAHLGNLAAAALRIPLQVRERDAARAKEILDALEDFEPAPPSDDDDASAPADVDMRDGEGPYRAAALNPPSSTRRPSVAIGAALILPAMLGLFGAGHFYARSYVRGALLLAAGWSVVVFGFATHGKGLLALPIVIALDAFGAARAVRAQMER
jgi:hypothetical protein